MDEILGAENDEDERIKCIHEFVVEAHRGDGKRFIVRADEKLTAFLELERAIYDFAVNLIS